MSFEIERKFLVRGDAWQTSATARIDVRQAYLAADGKVSLRVRIKDNTSATLTLKSRPHGLRRLELEYAIPVLEAEALIQLRLGAIVEKVRYAVPAGDVVWEIDVFSGENAGLTIAEVELHHEHQRIELPAWVGDEVTGQPQFYNSSLAQRPFCSWSQGDVAELTERRA